MEFEYQINHTSLSVKKRNGKIVRLDWVDSNIEKRKDRFLVWRKGKWTGHVIIADKPVLRRIVALYNQASNEP